MPRGFVVCAYTTDRGDQYALMVDADSAADPNRGWEVIPAGSLPYAPRGLLPRQVEGRDELGHTRVTRVGTATCDLWTFVATTWSLEGSDGLPHTVVATNRRQERQLGRKQDPV